MNDPHTEDTRHPLDPTIDREGQVAPDALMDDFRGQPLGKMILFTILVHVLFIGVFSLGYLKTQVFGQSTATLTEEQRMDKAVRDGTSALREIAERYGVRVQDLGSRFAGAPRTPPTPAATEANPDASTSSPTEPAEPDKPLSDIEKTLQEKKPGPATPDLSVDKEDDLFAPDTP